jgi:hypothetical protein
VAEGDSVGVSEGIGDAADELQRAQAIYWTQLVEIKGLGVFIRRYRDDQAKWVRRIGIVKAVAASSTIAGWSIWKDYALAWGIILALSQLLDAVREYLPHQKQQRAASDLAGAIDMLFIDAQFEWSVVRGGQLEAEQIMARWRNLAKLRLEAERKFFPDGVARSERLQSLARGEVDAYFQATYDVGDKG